MRRCTASPTTWRSCRRSTSFPPVVDDPYTFGAIAAANAMSDVYAMGGDVLMALNIAAFPQDLDPAILARIFHGGAEKVSEAGGVIAGGHTVYDVEPKYGLAVTGVIHPRRVFAKAGAQPGDALVLTKPLGTGLLLTAARDDRDPADHAAAAIASMLTLNRHASHLAREANAHAMTDVTGFGLLGHAREMASRGGMRFVIESPRVPAFPGAIEYAASGIVTGGANRNREGLADHVEFAAGIDPSTEALLFDPRDVGRPADRAAARRGRGDGRATARGHAAGRDCRAGGDGRGRAGGVTVARSRRSPLHDVERAGVRCMLQR